MTQPGSPATPPRPAAPTLPPPPAIQTAGGRAPQPAARVRVLGVGRDVTAALLLVVAALLPWNVEFGLGTPDTFGWALIVLTVTTVLALGAVAVNYVGAGTNSLMRLLLTAPYLVFVVAVLTFAVVQAVRSSGGSSVPPGVGPGAWLGVAGALLAAQPPLAGAGDDDRFRPWLAALRVLAWGSMGLAALFTLFNQFWRIQNTFAASPGFGARDLMVILSIVVYGVAGLVTVVFVARWLLDTRRATRLAVVALGAATLFAGTLVWVLGPIGREIDAFHGIAQSTGTMFVGFEGYLVWAAAAAVLAPVTLLKVWGSGGTVWRDAARKLLLLVAFWGAASAVLRLTDLLVSTTLDVKYSSYSSAALLVFDLIWVGLAIWLRRNLDDESVPPHVLTAIGAAIFVLAVCRIVVGVVLAPRFVYLSGLTPADNPVFGNELAQQFTSTFDVVMVGVAAAVLAVVVATGQLGGYLRSRAAAAAPAAPAAVVADTPATEVIGAPATEVLGRPADPATQRMELDGPTMFMPVAGDATEQIPAGTTPKIFREAGSPTQQLPSAAATQQMTAPTDDAKPRIHRALQESSQRFAAGTTYGGPDQSRLTDSSE